MSNNITGEGYSKEEIGRLHAESDAAALHALAVLWSEGIESAAFLEADAASEQATQKWLEANRNPRRPTRRKKNKLKVVKLLATSSRGLDRKGSGESNLSSRRCEAQREPTHPKTDGSYPPTR